MSLFYEHNVRLTGMDVDGCGRCKASALLNHLQISATLAAEAGGFGRDITLGRHGAFWMLARSWFELERPIVWDDSITIRTWHRGGNGAIMYRDYDILVNGQPVGQSVSGWVLADVASRKLLRLSGIQELAGTSGGELCKSINLTKVRQPQQLQQVEQRMMRYSDTDINGHVNNTRYADFACDVARLEQRDGNSFLTSLQIGYLAECRAGEVLWIETGELEKGQYVRGVDKGGKSRFEAALFFGEVLP